MTTEAEAKQNDKRVLANLSEQERTDVLNRFQIIQHFLGIGWDVDYLLKILR